MIKAKMKIYFQNYFLILGRFARLFIFALEKA